MKAYIFNIMGWMMLPFMDGLAKYLSSDMHFLQVVWGRYFFMLLITVIISYFFFRKYLIKPNNITIQIIRSFLLFITTILFFYSISIISLPEALTLAFISPIVVTVFSIILLKEKVGLHRWIAVITGFLGVLIVMRPGFNEINLATLSALFAGIIYALFIIYTRKLSFTDSPFVTLIFTSIVGSVLISLIVPFYWINLNFNQILLLILLASIGSLGHFLIILSLQIGEASKLSPLGYFEIITNIFVSYAFFGYLGNFYMYAGLILIVLSGIYIVVRENKLKENN
tara:strand:- start:294 stop:1145 length:852 start_codon:yes stop_codon:yes gene_type:complete